MRINLSGVTFILFMLPHPYEAARNTDFSAYPQWQYVIQHEQFTPAKHPYRGDLKSLLDTVQARYQNMPYKTDMENYGVEEHWATREELKAKGSGDCEDFAIAKYYDLLEAGIPDSDMELLFVAMEYRPANAEKHVVLKVRNWILDNRRADVYSLDEFNPHYRIVYSINRIGYVRYFIESMPEKMLSAARN